MKLDDIISKAAELKSTDIHIESNGPIVFRINGHLHFTEFTLSSIDIKNHCEQLLNTINLKIFNEKGSFDYSKNIQGIRCRINIFKNSKGIGMAIRLLSSQKLQLKELNLHPIIDKIPDLTHGLILFCGSTGSGKSTSMAAIIEEINARYARHILTIEEPIEYVYRKGKSLIRQREVGIDTPTYTQALKDCLREDPDVIIVGEMRDKETMEMTLNAASTGHLVMSSVHSSSVSEALMRVVGSFPAGDADLICQKLADSLQVVVCQNLIYQEKINQVIPLCEILFTSESVRNCIRGQKLDKIKDCIQTGAEHGMINFQRYQRWIDEKRDWVDFKKISKLIPEDYTNSHRNSIAFASTIERNIPKNTQKKSHIDVINQDKYSYDDDMEIIIDDYDDHELDSIIKNL